MILFIIFIGEITLKKRNDLKNFFILILLVILSLFLEKTPFDRYVGYHKIKEYVMIEYNIFPLAKEFFGDKLFYFYNNAGRVSSNILKEEEYGDGYIVYITDTIVYSNIIGSVISITKDNDNYVLIISGVNNEFKFSGIKEINVSLYQKVEVDTILGYTLTNTYYYEKN